MHRSLLSFLFFAVTLVPGVAEEKAPAPAAKEESAEARSARIAKARVEAIGSELPVLKAGVREYKKVVISGFDDVGVKIRHEAGVARIKFQDLPGELRERFGFDEIAAREQKERQEKLAEVRAARLRANLKSKSSGGGKGESRKGSGKKPERSEEMSREDLAKIRALEGKIRSLQAGKIKAQAEIDDLLKRAGRHRDTAQTTVVEIDGNGRRTEYARVNQSKIRRAESYERRAVAEEEKIKVADDLIRGYEDQIKELKRRK